MTSFVAAGGTSFSSVENDRSASAPAIASHCPRSSRLSSR